MGEEIRRCWQCGDFYDPWRDNHEVGRCLLFDAVDTMKRKFYKASTTSKNLCRYGLKEGEEVKLTQENIASVINRAPDCFWKEIAPLDIRLTQLIDSMKSDSRISYSSRQT